MQEALNLGKVSFAYDQSGAEGDGSNFIREPGGLPYTVEEESELDRDQSENQPELQPEPGVQREMVESQNESIRSRTGWHLGRNLRIMLKRYQRFSLVCDDF